MKVFSNKTVIIPNFDSLSDSAYLRANQLILGKQNVGATSVLPFSRATLWRLVKKASFPSPIQLSRGVTAFNVGEVRIWLEARKVGGAK